MYHVLTFAQTWLCLKTQDTPSYGRFSKDSYENPLELLGGVLQNFQNAYVLFISGTRVVRGLEADILELLKPQIAIATERVRELSAPPIYIF
jgi:hypothetical protein